MAELGTSMEPTEKGDKDLENREGANSEMDWLPCGEPRG